MTGRKLMIGESKRTELEQLVSVATWATRRFQYYIAASDSYHIVLPDPDYVKCIAHEWVHPSLRAYLVELSIYSVKWVAGGTVQCVH